jgi:hypothetical protein
MSINAYRDGVEDGIKLARLEEELHSVDDAMRDLTATKAEREDCRWQRNYKVGPQVSAFRAIIEAKAMGMIDTYEQGGGI